jgi:predicted RecA/RadA family phage recombinase
MAQCLAVLLSVPYLLGVVTIRPASAQARRSEDVVVMDFNNRTKVGGSLLGRTAAAQLTLEMQGSERWEIVKEAAVQAELNRLNLRPPFDTIALVRLAQALQASRVVVGDVVSVHLTENPAQASVTLAIQILDPASQEMVNGAVTTGRSAPRIGYTGDPSLLVDEAVGKATFQAREAMERTQLVEGTVLNTSVVGTTYDALMNIGARQGVREGMRFIILRGNELVGRGRARSVDPDFSTVAVTDNYQGVKPEDRCRAVFQLPPVPRETSAVNGARTVALQGQQPADQGPSGDVTVPDVTPKAHEKRPSMTKGARLLAGSLVVLGLVALAGRRGGTDVFNTEAQASSIGTDPAIRVTWARPRQISSEDVVQYQVVRQSAIDGQCAVGVVFGDTREFLDGTSATAAVRNLGQIVTTGTSGGTGGGTGGTTSLGVAACADAVLPIIAGRTYTYSVQTVYIPPLSSGTGGGTGGGGGGTTTTSTLISTPSTPSGPVTALALPTLVAPAEGATGVDLSAVNFQFMSVAGATSYVVQVSTDPSFSSGTSEVARVANASQQAGQTLSSGPVNLQARFGGRSQLFWRVGARNDSNSTQPTGGFVFSTGRGFTAATP